jgi:hypothetical protein
MYNLQTLGKHGSPILSRHGPKGGRFFDSMYTTKQGITCILGITIIHETGILSDHDMVISKCDLGLEKFEISKEKEEQFDFHHIMNIPVAIKTGDDHPSLNEKP